MRVLIAGLLLAVASPAFAQSGPSFDCAKASNAIEKTTCKDPELAKADREMVAAYAVLVAKLSGAAKDHLVKDQQSWIGARNRACVADTDGIAPCLKTRYAARTTNLRAFADGAYPFIAERSILRSGKLGKISYSIDIGYPKFEGPTADFSALNARFADAAAKAAEEATPKADSGVDREQGWTYEQGFKLYRPGARAITVAVNFYGYSGGAHGYGATRCTLVDLGTGKAVTPEGVFAAGDPWLKTMVEIVGADLKKQFVKKPGFDDALEPAKLAKLLRDPDNYCWQPHRLELIFNAYEVGPYSSGPFEVHVPYDRLKPMLRADGPIPR
jgi:uncharacterized protein YecT (DUF1311 family)